MSPYSQLCWKREKAYSIALSMQKKKKNEIEVGKDRREEGKREGTKKEEK